MITVTEGAKQELKRMLASKVDNYYAGVRLTSIGKGELGLQIDIQMPGDYVVEYEGSKVLLVENELAHSLKGVTLDVDETANGVELVICGSVP